MKSEMYKFLQAANEARKKYKVWDHKHAERVVEDHVYIFNKGLVLICTTNIDDLTNVIVKKHSYPEGTKLCNIYDTKDCVLVKKTGIEISMTNGLPKIYIPG